MNVAVIGASNKPERYSYKAIKLLSEKGHVVFPVHPRIKDIEGQKVYARVSDIKEPIDTITFYVATNISDSIADDVLAQTPQRIIFNPGAENKLLFEKAKTAGIHAINACTLVLLKTGQF
ncbi:MAG: CoA-binding protein [Candidatus Aceula meridiana]|nr:CoA-binding protein [Candidatus Aceula meridiana]